MIIRQAQVKAFAASNSVLENQMVEHMTVFSGDHMESLGETGTRRFVRFAIQRCAEYGWTQKGPVEFFLEVMVMLGSSFDSDPQYPWAQEALGDRKDQMAGADLLHARMMEYYDSVFGPCFDHQIQAIHRLLGSEAQLSGVLNRVGESEMVRLLQWAYPEKAAFVGDGVLHTLVAQGREAARQHGLVEPAAVALVTAILYSLGHGCFEDPLYPWVAAAVEGDDGQGSRRLYLAFKSYLQHAVANLERS